MAPLTRKAKALSTSAPTDTWPKSKIIKHRTKAMKPQNLNARKPGVETRKALLKKLEWYQKRNKPEHQNIILNLQRILDGNNEKKLAALSKEELQECYGLSLEEAEDVDTMDIDGPKYYYPSNSSGYSGESGENDYSQSEVDKKAAEDGSVQENPTTANLTGNPSTYSPTTGNPTAGNPTTGNPTTGNPTAGNPTAGNPTAGNPITGAMPSIEPAVTSGGVLQSNEPANIYGRVLQSIEPADTKALLSQPKVPQDNELFQFGPEFGMPLGIVRPVYYMKGEDVRTVGWSGHQRCRQYVNQYGKKSAAQYRIEKHAYPSDYSFPIEQNVAVPKNTSFRYPKGKHTFIFGVAWRSKIRSNLEDDLTVINPSNHRSFKHTVTRVLVGWESNGQGLKKWETRSTFRNLVGDKANADMVIYKAAVAANKNYIEAGDGRRQANSMSPDAPLAEVDRRRDGSGKVDTDGWSPTPEPTPSPRSSLPPEPSMDEQMKAFVRTWLSMAGYGGFEDLDAAQQQKCTNSWLIQQSVLLKSAA